MTREERLKSVNNININGNNYDRTQTIFEFSIGTSIKDITAYVRGIEYNEVPDIQFGYTLGSRRPSDVGFGNITSEGTLTVNDAGLAFINDFAIATGLPSMIYIGQLVPANISISYTMYNGKVKRDVLENVFFTKYENGVNTEDVINTREISMIIGKIDPGVSK